METKTFKKSSDDLIMGDVVDELGEASRCGCGKWEVLLESGHICQCQGASKIWRELIELIQELISDKLPFLSDSIVWLENITVFKGHADISLTSGGCEVQSNTTELREKHILTYFIKDGDVRDGKPN